MLVSGAAAVALAQVVLYFSVEPNVAAPTGYLLLLALGVALFALGSAGFWFQMRSSGSGNAGMAFPERAPVPLNVFSSALGTGGLLAGLILMVVLLVLLARGSESGWTLSLWLLPLLAFATPFLSQLHAAVPLAPRFPGSWLGKHGLDLSIVVFLVAAFFAINLYDLQSWYYSAIGDEYIFFEHAKHIADEGITRPFSQEGVYNNHPVMNSVFQATAMRVFGADYLGWKFSETFNAALTIPAIYVLGRLLGGRVTAVVAAAIFAFSHYIFAFSHTGYNNLSALPVAVWAMALFVAGWRNGNPLLLYAAGVVAGLGFYTHYSGRAILPIIVLFSLMVARPGRLAGLWPLTLGFALAALPTFVVEQEAVLTRMFGEVVGGYSEVVTGSVGNRLLDNIILNLPAFSYNASVHTYVYGPLLDPVSGTMATLGLAFALGGIRQAENRLLLVWFGVAMFMTGILSPYPHTAVTRLLFAVPPLALLGGLMVERLCDTLSDRQPSLSQRAGQFIGPPLLAALVAAVLALNLWQFWHVTPSVFPHTREAVALGAFRSENCDAHDTLFVGPAVDEGSLMRQVLYSIDPQAPPPPMISHAALSEGAELPDPLPGCVVFIDPRGPEASRLREELSRRYPEGRVATFFNPSRINFAEMFVRE